MNPVKLYTTLANTQLAAKKRVLTAVSAVGLPPWPRSAGRQHLMDLFQDGIPVSSGMPRNVQQFASFLGPPG
jgi:hypothetical protein